MRQQSIVRRKVYGSKTAIHFSNGSATIATHDQHPNSTKPRVESWKNLYLRQQQPSTKTMVVAATVLLGKPQFYLLLPKEVMRDDHPFSNGGEGLFYRMMFA